MRKRAKDGNNDNQIDIDCYLRAQKLLRLGNISSIVS